MGELDIRLLGEFKLLRDGRELELPPSRKTRGLLAWLALHRRRYRREQLCELLWEVPDDPRGALRWSLSKLRRLLDDDDRRRVIADRNGVEIDVSDVTIDLCELQALAGRLAEAPLPELEEAAARFRGNFLEDLEFSGYHQFHAWCIAEREQAARAQALVRRELVGRLKDAPERALPHARALVDIAPYDEASRALLIRLLHRSGRVEEAGQQYELGMRMLKEAGIVSTGALLSALRRGEPDAGHAPAAAAAEGAPDEGGPEDIRLIGREAERQQVEAAIKDLAGSRAAEMMLVLGEPGIGKSHLLDYAVRWAREHGACVLEACAFESERIRPFALWIDALRACEGDAAQRVFCDNEVENRDRLFSRLAELVHEESEQRPVVMAFDDVQWCDESSAAALHYVVRTNRDRPLFCIVAARDGELQDNIPLQQALRGLRNAGMLHELRLPPLTDASTARLIAAHAPDADADRLSRECGGNPLFAIELARAGKDGAGCAPLNQLVRERLARLDVNGAEVLRWAALLGSRIELPTLVRLSGVSDEQVAATLEAAERQAILVATDQGLRFSHELIARAVYGDISPVRRQVMHRRIAELMAEDAALDPRQASELAYHATQSGDPKLAARAMVSAARLCLRFFANREALSLARRGLELADALPAADRVCVNIELHEIISAAAPLDDWEAAARRYAELAEEALDHGALGHARRGYNLASFVRWQHGHWTGALEQTLQSERAVRGATEKERIIGMADTAKCLAMIERDLSQADAMLMEAQARAARQNLRHQSIPAGLGMLRFYENRLDEAEELFREARTLCKSAGDRLSEYQANEYLVMIALQRGAFDEAHRRCTELLALGRKLREGSEAPFAAALEGLCRYALEDDAAPLEQALGELRIADAKHRLAFVLTRAALLDYERGRVEKAVGRATEALAYAELLQRATEMLLAHVVLDLGLRASGRAAEAERHGSAITSLEAAGVAAWAAGMAEQLGRVRPA